MNFPAWCVTLSAFVCRDQRYVEAGACLDWFHNRQNKLEFLWDPRLSRGWMAALFCCIKTLGCLRAGWLVRGSLRPSARLTFRCWNCQHVRMLHICSPYHQSPANYCTTSLRHEDDDKPHKSWQANVTYWDCLPDLCDRGAGSKTEQATEANQRPISSSLAKYLCPCCRFDLRQCCSCWRHAVPKMRLIGLS